MLDQIERALYAEDPKFANTVRETNPAVHYKRWILKASIGFFVGVALLMGGVIAQQVAVGVIGFIVMLACTLWGMSGYRRVANGGGAETKAAPERGQRRQRPGVMDRFEERWRRRQEGDH
ncbi:hypothetical protein F4561_001755 [Lipingzhangella halophila]|uniref:DUF3040 family protein n=2 Tax=Lipingzhangella halophila TaxID=1783352 RepID=A0A7W7RFJ5_9ACTN|nr:hypothetical protein [Lipingzhangella halophila]